MLLILLATNQSTLTRQLGTEIRRREKGNHDKEIQRWELYQPYWNMYIYIYINCWLYIKVSWVVMTDNDIGASTAIALWQLNMAGKSTIYFDDVTDVFPSYKAAFRSGGFQASHVWQHPRVCPLIYHYYSIINYKSYFSWYFNISEFHMFPLLLMFPLCHWGIVYLGTPITAEAWVTATAAQFINQLTTSYNSGGPACSRRAQHCKNLVSWRLYI